MFFAAWPTAGVQEKLHAIAQQARRECGGRAVAQGNIHLTLAFLGDVPRDRVHQIESVAAEISGSRCDIAVDRLQYWKHNRILWAGVERCPEPLAGLAGKLSVGLRAIGFKLDDRPYVLHVTLLRNARCAPAERSIPAVAWPIADVALVESLQRGDGRVYEVLRRWPLGG
ncbi:MAG TPA: RNA 2',3'-cyclic phosphodiesterase [Burkholderiales bacterium]|nr:RNA 2',3'-cyclic phosphodiesterase [Burkholderiales bacterium]